MGTPVESGTFDNGGETGRTKGIFFGVLLKIVAPIDVRILSVKRGWRHFAKCNLLKRETFFRGKRVEVVDKQVKKTTPENGKGDVSQHLHNNGGEIMGSTSPRHQIPQIKNHFHAPKNERWGVTFIRGSVQDWSAKNCWHSTDFKTAR